MFRVDIYGEYGDDDTSIHLMDERGEIVSWNSDEWKAEPSLVVVIANAIRLGYTENGQAVRDRMGR